MVGGGSGSGNEDAEVKEGDGVTAVFVLALDTMEADAVVMMFDVGVLTVLDITGDLVII